jgi:hypothetical protein
MSRGRCLGAEPGTPRQVAGSAMPPGSLDAAKPRYSRGVGLKLLGLIAAADAVCRAAPGTTQDKCRTDFSGRQQAPACGAL